MNKYETIFVIDSLLKPEEIENIVTKYERFISANGGKIETIDQWGKKRLAYEIKKRQYGYYVLIRFDGPPTMIKQLEREYRLNESILRYKVLKMDKAAINALTQPAKKAKKPASAESTDKPAKENTAAEKQQETKEVKEAKEPKPEKEQEPKKEQEPEQEQEPKQEKEQEQKEEQTPETEKPAEAVKENNETEESEEKE